VSDFQNNQGRKQKSSVVLDERGKFVKGFSGNPNGRPKGQKNRTTLMKEGMEADWLKFLKEEDPSREERISRWNLLMERVYEQAMKGDAKALNLIIGEVHKDLRVMNQIQAKTDAGPRSVKININTKGPKEVGQVIDQVEEELNGSSGTEGSTEHSEDHDRGL
jgi:hypothetical protein